MDVTAWASLDTPIGALILEGDEGGLTAVHLPNGHPASLDPDAHAPERLAEPLRQLAEYFAGERTAFALPLTLRGSTFDRAVWQALGAVGYGRTVSYAELARAIGRPDGTRAVAAANGRNPLPIVVPCHRVIGSDGGLVGYGGGLARKQALLDLEAGRWQQALW